VTQNGEKAQSAVLREPGAGPGQLGRGAEDDLTPTGQTISSSRRESGLLTLRLILKME